MATISYHASHEQFKPGDLVNFTILAEKSGFTGAACSDHFHPWSEAQGQSGFSFAWLGAAMQATRLPFGVVFAPGQRYHPAIVAQAAATLSQMFPDRFYMALGSGEALNEKITGEKWPAKKERNQRLLESATVIKQLLAGETVNFKGLIKVENARLYTLPENPPLLVCAAVTKETAAWAGSWADGLITVHRPFKELKEVVQAFRDNGGSGKPVFLKSQISFAKTEAEALAGAHEQWRTNVLDSSLLADMVEVRHFDAAAQFVKPDDMFEMVRISADPKKQLDWILQDLELGFDNIVLHNVNRAQEFFIQEFGEKVLPQLKG